MKNSASATNGMIATIQGAGYALNPVWSSPTSVGSGDPTINGFVQNPLSCTWGRAAANDGTYILTSVSAFPASDHSAIASRLEALTAVTTAVGGGTRYVTDGGSAGESYFLQDGILVATTWSGFGPDGYTADIVAHLFG